MTTDIRQSIEFVVPLPPVELRANGRAHYRVKGRAADEYSLDVLAVFSGVTLAPEWPQPQRWKAAHVTYTWCYAGVAPDHGNLGGNVKYLQDILCFAPKKAAKNRWYMGIVEDDKGITANYLLYRVKHKADECVHIRIERL